MAVRSTVDNKIVTRRLALSLHCKSKILGLDGGRNGSQVGVLKLEGDKVSLGSLLQCHHGRRLEVQVGLPLESSLAA